MYIRIIYNNYSIKYRIIDFHKCSAFAGLFSLNRNENSTLLIPAILRKIMHRSQLEKYQLNGKCHPNGSHKFHNLSLSGKVLK